MIHQIKIAKKVMQAFLNTNDECLQLQMSIAKQLSNKSSKYFYNDRLIHNDVFFYVDLNLRLFGINKTYHVGIVFLYVDKKDKHKEYPRFVKNYGTGQGEAVSYPNDKYYIVVYGDSKQNYNERYFKNTFIHEMMHVIDNIIDEQKTLQTDFYGHKNEKGKVPFPKNEDDLFDEKFAEYFTCKAQRKEYTFDLLDSIEQFADATNQTEQQTVQLIKNSLHNKSNFMKLIEQFKKQKINYAPLTFIYHFVFSKQKNGNKQTALNILNSFI